VIGGQKIWSETGVAVIEQRSRADETVPILNKSYSPNAIPFLLIEAVRVIVAGELLGGEIRIVDLPEDM
jgi:hypothetical protein